MKKITLTKNGLTKTTKQGFSWTTLFFGGLVPLFRGDVKWCIIWLLGNIPSFGILGWFMAFKYNKIYVENLIENGWTENK